MLALLLTLAAVPAGVSEVRSEVAQVEMAYLQGRLSTEHHIRLNADQQEVTCDRWYGASGTVRRLTYAGGSSDSFTSLAQTYDAAGRLRFAVWRGGAVNGTHNETRLYFDTDGKLLQRLETQNGPGYPFDDPARQLLFTAKAAATAPCQSSE